MDISVLILFHERIDQTIECINSFLSERVPIYILNNGSDKNARKRLGDFCAKYNQITIFDSDRNIGAAAGRNFLIRHSSEDWLFFTDNDIVINTTDWMKNIKEHVTSYKDTEVFIPKIFNGWEQRYEQPHSLAIADDRAFYCTPKQSSTNIFPAGAAIVSRKLFDRLGLYDEEVFTVWEDYELSLRAIREGFTINAKYIEDIELIHNHRKAQNASDVKAALTRYDHNAIKSAAQHIYNKHKIKIQDNWKPWSDKQVRGIIGDKMHLFKSVRNALFGYIAIIIGRK